MANVNRTKTQAHDAQVLAGIQKHLLTVPSLPLAGKAFTPAELMKLVQSRIDSAAKVAAADAQRHSMVTADRTLGKDLTPILRGLRQYVLNVFGEDSPVLADFGFKAPKKATLTPEQKAAKAAKAKATREARHTKGPKQKKGVKGDVTGITLTPVTAGKPVAPSPAANAPTQGTGGGSAPHIP